MRSVLLLVAIAGFSCAALPAYQSGSARVLTSETGARVEMVRGQADNTYYIRVTGSGAEIDGYVLVYALDTDMTRRDRWVTDIHGRRWFMLHKDHPATFKLYATRNTEATVLDLNRDIELDVEELLRAHVRQRQNGSLAKLQKFDRRAEELEYEKEIRDTASRVAKTCGAEIDFEVDWPTISDELFMEANVPAHCEVPLLTAEELCKTRAARESVSADLRRVVCRLAEESSIVLADGTLTWIYKPKGADYLDDRAREYFLDHAPWSAGNLRLRVNREQAVLCADDKGHYVGRAPDQESRMHVIYFDGERWISTRHLGRYASGEWFYDPRFVNPDANPSNRGIDMRVVSTFNPPAETSGCSLRCGKQTIPLRLLGDQEKYQILPAAPPANAPVPRRPYGLARDRRGTYYFVDVGGDKDARDFRVYVGPKGAMELQDMKNVVTDSQGDIFVTTHGELRLILEQPESAWVHGKKSTSLTNLPIADNLDVIHNQLGPYIGQLFGTPCDHM